MGNPKKNNINLKIWENNILFSIFNTFDHAQAQNNAINKNSGLGLENVKRRLELLYPDKYELSLEEKSNTYKVLLQLKQS
jgi:LytS/YehU family sensor histidine kinase